jgi:protein-disulfide isomerase
MVRLLKIGTFCAAFSVAATVSFGFDMGEMTTGERQAFRGEIREYLLENPEIIMEAIGVLEAREAAQQADADKRLLSQLHDEIFEDGRSWVGGNPEGDITLVEFMDYRCSYCRRAFHEVEQLLADDTNIRFVLKEFPILGEQSVLAARFAIATRNVAGDDAYKAVHDALIVQRANVTPESLSRLADDLSLDGAQIMAAMDAPEIVEELRANRELAQQLQINGTPSFIIEDEMLRGYLPAAQMQDLIADIRAR